MPSELPSWKSNVDDLKPFARVCLVAVDLDGTLIGTTNPRIFDKINSLFNSLHHYRVRITFATGRTLSAVRPLINQLRMNALGPMILYNGSVVVKNGNFHLLRKHGISIKSLGEILRVCGNYHVNIFAYLCEEKFGLQGLSENIIGWSNGGPEANSTLETQETVWLSLSELPRFNPAAVLVDVSSDLRNAETIRRRLKRISNVSPTRSGERYIEVRPAEANKGTALEFVASTLGISNNQVLALGDNDNDIEMLRWAGIAVAIGKASKRALNECDYVCKYGAANGAIQLLRTVRQARRFRSPLGIDPANTRSRRPVLQSVIN